MQVPRRLKFPQGVKVEAKVVDGPQCIWVVITKHTAVPGDGVLMQVPCSLKIADST